MGLGVIPSLGLGSLACSRTQILAPRLNHDSGLILVQFCKVFRILAAGGIQQIVRILIAARQSFYKVGALLALDGQLLSVLEGGSGAERNFRIVIRC